MVMTRGQFAQLLAPGLRQIFLQFLNQSLNHPLQNAFDIEEEPEREPIYLWFCSNCMDFVFEPKPDCKCGAELIKVEA